MIPEEKNRNWHLIACGGQSPKCPAQVTWRRTGMTELKESGKKRIKNTSGGNRKGGEVFHT